MQTTKSRLLGGFWFYVIDSGFLSILPHTTKHFVRAEVRYFNYSDKENALKWLLDLQ